MALTAGGSFSCVQPSVHAETNAVVIQRFLPVVSEMRELASGRWRISLLPRARQRS
jgi:RNA 3'-terminal phosphate cyclase (ATP)